MRPTLAPGPSHRSPGTDVLKNATYCIDNRLLSVQNRLWAGSQPLIDLHIHIMAQNLHDHRPGKPACLVDD